MKKIGIATASAILLLSTANINVYSAPQDMVVRGISCYAEENGEAEMRIEFENNPGISACSMEICFDSENLIYRGAENGDVTKNGTFYCNGDLAEDRVKIVWSDSSDTSEDGTAAVIKFRTRTGAKNSDILVSIGRCEFVNATPENVKYTSSDGSIKVVNKINYGDIDLNGIVDVCDVVRISYYLLDQEKYSLDSDSAKANADVDRNGIINMSDAGKIINMVAEII